MLLTLKYWQPLVSFVSKANFGENFLTQKNWEEQVFIIVFILNWQKGTRESNEVGDRAVWLDLAIFLYFLGIILITKVA